METLFCTAENFKWRWRTDFVETWHTWSKILRFGRNLRKVTYTGLAPIKYSAPPFTANSKADQKANEKFEVKNTGKYEKKKKKKLEFYSRGSTQFSLKKLA